MTLEESNKDTSYDTLPYPPYSFPATHIGRLGAIGTIFGLSPANPSKTRVLELGCGVGVNLMAMAQLYPESEFVGIDASKKQIEIGQQALKAASLENLRLIAADLSKVDEDLGKFDYIIAHGIFSWVPNDVKEAIFKICKNNLNKDGIAYISYNCLPGWRMRGALRDMMLMHTAGIPDLLGKVAQGKALIKFLAESCSEETPYGKYLRQELEMLTKVDDSYIAHEFLECENEPLYFTDFLKAADKHGLAYLGDADPATMVADNLPEQTAKTLKSLNLNLLATEQYMDFLRNRTFRSTLLCHSGSALNRNVSPEKLQGLSVASLIGLKQPHNGSQPAIFVGSNGMELTVSDSITAAVFKAVAGIGRKVRPVSAFIEDLRPVLSGSKAVKNEAALPDAISQILLHGYFKKMLDFTLTATGATAESDANPVVLPLARWQAANGLRVSSQRLDMLNSDPFVAKFITLCDGTRDREALIKAMVEAHDKKEYQLNEDNKPVTDSERARLIIERLFEGSLQNLENLGLLLPKAA